MARRLQSPLAFQALGLVVLLCGVANDLRGVVSGGWSQVAVGLTLILVGFRRSLRAPA